jgi:GxxExxY protein
MDENKIGSIVVDCAVALHRDLGPGLLETVYEVTLARALERRGLHVERQVAVPIEYEGERFVEGFRADLIVEGKVLLELKSVERVTPAHKKQLLTYLRLTGLKLGYLLNFGEALMRDGITRTINGSLDPISLRPRASVRENSSEKMFSQRHKGTEGLTL